MRSVIVNKTLNFEVYMMIIERIKHSTFSQLSHYGILFIESVVAL